MKFEVKRYWSVCDTVVVEADSITAAIDCAYQLPVDVAKSEFVPDSMNTDPKCEVKPLASEGNV